MLERLRNKRERDEGFTLIELLIVIVILGILAAIVVFAVSGITNRGTEAACKSNFSRVVSAQETHFAQKGTYAANTGALVTAGYLREPVPPTSATEDALAQGGYFITTTSSGDVTVTNMTGTLATGDDTTSTAGTNCPT